jgi:hypothetical protein
MTPPVPPVHLFEGRGQLASMARLALPAVRLAPGPSGRVWFEQGHIPSNGRRPEPARMINIPW